MIGFKVIFPADNPDDSGNYNGLLYKLDDSDLDRQKWFSCKAIKAKTPEAMFKTAMEMMQHQYEVQLERNQNNYD